MAEQSTEAVAQVARNEWYAPDALAEAIGDSEGSLSVRLSRLRNRVVDTYGLSGLHRIAIAVYEPEDDQIQTFANAGDEPSELVWYSAYLSECGSLSQLSREGGIRVIHELQELPGKREHTRSIARQGFRSSLTLPIHYAGKFYGFVFMNSRQPGFFDTAVLERLLPYARLVGMLGAQAIREARLVRGTVGATIVFSRARDAETSEHMERIAELTRLIASRLAPQFGFTDEFITMMAHFAPLHDLGKIAIPDEILLKPGRLTDAEFARMQEHVAEGLRLLERMTNELELSDQGQMQLLREIIAYHHERLDGSGYPYGLRGEQIPWAGRILAVADVYDALTSARPYKRAWTVDEAAAVLREEAGTKLCPHSVRALLEACG